MHMYMCMYMYLYPNICICPHICTRTCTFITYFGLFSLLIFSYFLFTFYCWQISYKMCILMLVGCFCSSEFFPLAISHFEVRESGCPEFGKKQGSVADRLLLKSCDNYHVSLVALGYFFIFLYPLALLALS